MNNPNPYAPPVATVEDAVLAGSDGNFVPGGRVRPAGSGTAWLSVAWAMFKSSPFGWIGLTLLFFVVYFILAIIPLVGFLVVIVMPVLWGGIMVAADNQRLTGRLAVGDLFAGFQRRTGSLLMIGLILFGLSLLMLVGIGVVVGFGVLMAALTGGDVIGAMPGLASILVASLIAIVISAAIYAALWYAPALVLFHDLGAVEAMQMSLMACIRNMLPGLVYFVVVLVLGFLALLPVMLGWLVLAPVLWIAIYTAYRDIFIEE